MIRPAIRETTSVQKWHPSPKATSATLKVIYRVGKSEWSNTIRLQLPRPSRFQDLPDSSNEGGCNKCWCLHFVQVTASVILKMAC